MNQDIKHIYGVIFLVHLNRSILYFEMLFVKVVTYIVGKIALVCSDPVSQNDQDCYSSIPGQVETSVVPRKVIQRGSQKAASGR